MSKNKYRSHFDQHCNFWKHKDGSFVLYVNNMLIVTKSKIEVKKLKTQFKSKFEMKDPRGKEDSRYGD